MSASAGTEPVYLELGTRKVFACSLVWPGWCRSGRHEDAALEALATYAPRYAAVARRAGRAFPSSPRLSVVARLVGNATTDFGAPAAVPPADRAALPRREAARLCRLVDAAWATFDAVAAGAPAVLRKGPRGGGRDRDAMRDHVEAAEAAYARKLGVRSGASGAGDTAGVAARRGALRAVLAAGGEPLDSAAEGWPVRYGARRIAWHALDHAWEMEDRSG